MKLKFKDIVLTGKNASHGRCVKGAWLNTDFDVFCFVSATNHLSPSDVLL